MPPRHLRALAALATCLIASSAAVARPVAGARASAARPAAQVYFAVHGVPFMSVYTGRGFRQVGGDVEALLGGWRTALASRQTFPGLAEDGRRVEVKVRGLKRLQGDVGEQPFDTDQPALFWSAPELELRALPLRAVPLGELDARVLQREAMARAEAWRRLKGTPGEGNPNPPRILDPREAGNLRLSATAPRPGGDLVLVRVELLTEDDGAGERGALEAPLLLLYSRARRAVLGSVGLASARLLAFEVAGDPAVYLLYEGGASECPGSTILPIDRIRGADLFPAPEDVASAWCS